MTLYGPDLSNNNWANSGEISGWLDDCFHREGYSWMEHKVSEGNYYKDPYWMTVRDWCRANNVPVIGYHYVTTNDAAQQAQKFVSNGGGSFAMLDFENNSGNIANFWNVVTAFNNAGVHISLSYIPHWYWQNIGSPSLSGVPGLVSSSYYKRGTFGSVEYAAAGGDGGSGWNGYGGASPAIWQFSDAALIGGKSVDVNAFRGSIDDLRRLLGGAPVPDPAPAPAPAPAPDPAPAPPPPVPTSNPPATDKPGDEAGRVSEIWDQVLLRWDMLDNHTLIEAVALIGQKLGLPFTPPS